MLESDVGKATGAGGGDGVKGWDDDAADGDDISDKDADGVVCVIIRLRASAIGRMDRMSVVDIIATCNCPHTNVSMIYEWRDADLIGAV